jgi:CheY-like chemotaxis protein
MVRAPAATQQTLQIEPSLQQVLKILSPPLRILHVDDSEGVLILQRLYLQRRSETGFDYVGVIDTASAMRTITTWKPDFILSDISRPCMDGFTFTAILKSRPDTQHIPIALLTAQGSQHNADRAFAAGASAFFTKPGFPYLDKIYRLAAQHRVDQVLRLVSPTYQVRVIKTLLAIGSIKPVIAFELKRRLAAPV